MSQISRRSFVVGAAALPMPIALSGCDRPWVTYRYRLTINVLDHGQMRSGSSVVEVEKTIERSIDETIGGVALKGEATAVALSDGRVVVALLDRTHDEFWPFGQRSAWRDDPTWILQQLYGLPDAVATGAPSDASALAAARGRHQLSPNQLPPLLVVQERNDPRSIQPIDPDNPGDVLGDGVTLKSIEIEVTSDAITDSLAETLPWVKQPNALPDGSFMRAGTGPILIQFRRDL